MENTYTTFGNMWTTTTSTGYVNTIPTANTAGVSPPLRPMTPPDPQVSNMEVPSNSAPQAAARGPVPKLSESFLRPMKNTFACRSENGLLYDYYPIVVKPGPSENLLLFVKAPPVIKDGVVTLNKEQYQVTIQDILRGRIRVATKLTTATNARNSRTTTPSTAGPRPGGTGNPISNNEQYGADDTLGIEVDKAADMAWEEQVGTLLSTVYSKEGRWEVERTPQS